jgi:hypothetical protein
MPAGRQEFSMTEEFRMTHSTFTHCLLPFTFALHPKPFTPYPLAYFNYYLDIYLNN